MKLSDISISKIKQKTEEYGISRLQYKLRIFRNMNKLDKDALSGHCNCMTGMNRKSGLFNEGINNAKLNKIITNNNINIYNCDSVTINNTVVNNKDKEGCSCNE